MNTYLTIFGKPRYLGFTNISNDAGFNLERPKWAVIKSRRGYEMGLPGGILTQEQKNMYIRTVGRYEDASESMLQDVIFVREADDEDIENYYRCHHEEEEALLIGRDILADFKLKMKLVDAEYMLDRRRLYFYFTSEQRVDFREYVKELACEFRTRIEMRQVGARDEARITQSVGPCGRQCCCAYWLRGFKPISIRIVKEQRYALTPTKISGACGRLMCCMTYEKELYSEMWEKLSKGRGFCSGTKIKSDNGSYILESIDVGSEHVNVRFPSGRLIPVSINDFPDFEETVMRGEEWGTTDEEKELAEKKRKSEERIAAIRARAQRLKSRGIRRHAKPAPKPSTEKPAADNTKPKKSKRKKHRNPYPKDN